MLDNDELFKYEEGLKPNTRIRIPEGHALCVVCKGTGVGGSKIDENAELIYHTCSFCDTKGYVTKEEKENLEGIIKEFREAMDDGIRVMKNEPSIDPNKKIGNVVYLSSKKI